MPRTKDQPKTIGAAELAEQLGTDPKELRKFLRAEAKNVGRGKRYEFTEPQAAAVRKKWEAAHSEEE